MPFVTSLAQAREASRTVDVHGQTYTLNPYVGSVPRRGMYVPGSEKDDDGLPQGFLVMQPPGSVTPPHFHDHEQFQVVVEGDGRIGRRPARPLSVHYAAGHTPYGPIEAGEDGLYYFTLRSRWDSGAKYMPGARDRLKPVRRRHRLVNDLPLPDPDGLAAGSSEWTDVMPVDEDGVSARLYRIAPGNCASLTCAAEAGGQYAIVVGGSLAEADGELDWLAGLYRFRHEAPLAVTAGPRGAAVLLMQFSRNDPA
ncbi:MAG: hypothetical protein OXE86_13795 [Alphaproteobacteria bacterium]|nr:hypothetical protein [Alphaproteobacteria bacterium]